MTARKPRRPIERWGVSFAAKSGLACVCVVILGITISRESGWRKWRRKSEATAGSRCRSDFRRFCGIQPGTEGRARLRQSVHAAGRRGAFGAGHRCRGQQGDEDTVPAGGHAGEDGGPRRGRDRGADQDHRALPQQGQEHLCAQPAVDRKFNSQVPEDRESLESLPGVGRKTANVVLNIAFQQPTIAVDTHLFRVSNRTGLAPGKTPLEVELGLLKVIPDQYMLHAHHWLILHGRYICKARKPDCWRCIISEWCRFEPKTPAPKGA